jgi:hypothetical protein
MLIELLNSICINVQMITNLIKGQLLKNYIKTPKFYTIWIADEWVYRTSLDYVKPNL